MPRRRGQVMVLFVAMLPILLGFLGMALDGGWYFALRRGAQFAASAAARAAAQEVQAGRYSNAVPWGQTVGLYDLRGYQLTGPAVALDFNDAPDATPTSPG
ncbi:MAG TPA: pilus assembly protein TadG-related protein [Chloroflexota bacterium]